MPPLLAEARERYRAALSRSGAEAVLFSRLWEREMSLKGD